jgi:hypothetical protein
MTIIVATPLLVAIIGLLVYALSSNTKVAELGRLAFACGLLVALLTLGQWRLG